jgi:hypothetical protein
MTTDKPEQCIGEAEECDRLAGLSRTTATRQILQSVASHWRKLAERAAERPGLQYSGPVPSPPADNTPRS